MPNANLQAALLGVEGHAPAKVTRIEIELLDNAQFRWTLWSDARRLFSLAGRSGDQSAMLAATAKIVDTELNARREAN
jgi:hypothetical protein